METILYVLLFSVCGILCCFFSAGGIDERKTFHRKLKDQGMRKQFAVLFLCTMTIGVYAFWLFRSLRDILPFMAMATFALSITPEDIRAHEIRTSTILCFALIFLLVQASRRNVFDFLDSGLGVFVALFTLGLPHLFRKSWFGGGDVLSVAACGILLGAVGTVQLLFRMFLMIVIYSVVLLIMKKATMKSEIPLAPFLLLAILF